MSASKINKIKKSFLYALVAVLSFVVINNFESQKGNFSIIRASVLSILNNIIEDSLPIDPDLSIASVSFKKISDPTPEFDYYKYNASLVIENEGGRLLNGTVTLSADHAQQHKYLINSNNGFSLKNSEKYIVKDFEVITDGKYNGGKITFNLELKAKRQKDFNLKNNTYTADYFSGPAKITEMSLKEIKADNSFDVDYKFADFALTEDKLQFFVSNAAEINPEDIRYSEYFDKDMVYSYFKAKSSLETVKNKNWREISEEELSKDYEGDFYVYAKAVNEKTGNYAVSNVLILPPQKKMTRAQFAKLFVEKADIAVINKGELPFSDVTENENIEYIQTLYNLGLFGDINDTNFYPEKEMTRAEALQIVMDYFDFDLMASESSHFQDVSIDDEIFPYTEGFFKSGKAAGLGSTFSPTYAATEEYLNYLIYGHL